MSRRKYNNSSEPDKRLTPDYRDLVLSKVDEKLSKAVFIVKNDSWYENDGKKVQEHLGGLMDSYQSICRDLENRNDFELGTNSVQDWIGYREEIKEEGISKFMCDHETYENGFMPPMQAFEYAMKFHLILEEANDKNLIDFEIGNYVIENSISLAEGIFQGREQCFYEEIGVDELFES